MYNVAEAETGENSFSQTRPPIAVFCIARVRVVALLVVAVVRSSSAARLPPAPPSAAAPGCLRSLQRSCVASHRLTARITVLLSAADSRTALHRLARRSILAALCRPSLSDRSLP